LSKETALGLSTQLALRRSLQIMFLSGWLLWTELAAGSCNGWSY